MCIYIERGGIHSNLMLTFSDKLTNLFRLKNKQMSLKAYKKTGE